MKGIQGTGYSSGLKEAFHIFVIKYNGKWYFYKGKMQWTLTYTYTYLHKYITFKKFIYFSVTCFSQAVVPE